MCNLSQGVREEGRMEGFAEGLAEGLEEGLTKGRVEMACNLIIRRMKKRNQTVIEVMNELDIDTELRPEISKFISAEFKERQ